VAADLHDDAVDLVPIAVQQAAQLEIGWGREADGGNPAPSVPTYAVLAPSADAALASSQAQVVLPLVPVTPAIGSRDQSIGKTASHSLRSVSPQRSSPVTKTALSASWSRPSMGWFRISAPKPRPAR
jgi:hypothetical protein